jgi:hypothetical protein
MLAIYLSDKSLYAKVYFLFLKRLIAEPRELKPKSMNQGLIL